MGLSAFNVSKTYSAGLIFKDHKHILEDITLKITKGKTQVLVGRSGSGKTTLGKILSGLEMPSGGRVLYDGMDIWKMKPLEFSNFKRSVQMVFQDPEGSLNPVKTIERSIHEVLALLKVPKDEWDDKTTEMLTTVGLYEDLLCRRPSQISGGQNQRIVLGRVLLLDPKIMILDEPTSALDISVQAQVLNLLKQLQKDRGIGYLLISHDPDVVNFMADDVVVLDGGRIAFSGSKDDWKTLYYDTFGPNGV